MSPPTQTLIAPVFIVITAVTANPDLTIDGIDLDSGTSISISIRADAFARSLQIDPIAGTQLLLVLSLQSMPAL